MSDRVFLAAFTGEREILAACRLARGRGWSIVDVHAPYAVHGLETAMGLPPSRLTWVCFLFGSAGVALGLWLQLWTSAVSWPINVGGRPWNSLPAFVPVTFEIMVLFAGLGSMLAFLIVGRLYPGKEADLPLPHLTDDRFLLIVREGDASFDPDEARSLFGSLGAVAVEERELEGR
jgi:hypothetical protein